MSLIGTTAEIVSAVYLLIIIIGIYHTSSEVNANTKAYNYCCWFCFVGLITDVMSYILLGGHCSDYMLELITFVAFIMFDFLSASYAIYMITYIKERVGKASKLFLWISLSLCAADTLFYVVGTVTGKLYIIDEGKILYGPWYDYITVVPVICFSVYIVYLLQNVRALRFRDLIVLSLYNVFQAVIAVIWIIEPNLISGYVGYAIALTTIFVMIQFRVISETSLQAEIYSRLSVRDALTGLKNRRGYNECLSAIQPEAGVCAVFCDINSLKTVNDTLGHEAGDQMIKKMADLMREVFTDDEMFRISGDEFVAIILNMDEETVSERVKVMREIIHENDRIASLGYAMGEGHEVMQVIIDAEQMMYNEKRDYYIETGKDRRHTDTFALLKA